MHLDEKSLVAGLSQVLGEQIKKICDEEAKKAGEEVERRIREQVGSIVARVSTWFTYERFGQDLKITVTFPNADDPPKT